MIAQPKKSDFAQALHDVLSSARTVLELGTGIGLTGLTIAKTYSHLNVILTDLESARLLVERNIALNDASCRFEAIDWTSPTVQSPVDVLVMTDVTYNETYHDALMNTIKSIADANTKVIFTSKYRHARYVFHEGILISERAFIDRLPRSHTLLLDSDFTESSASPSLGSIELIICNCISG